MKEVFFVFARKNGYQLRGFKVDSVTQQYNEFFKSKDFSSIEELEECFPEYKEYILKGHK